MVALGEEKGTERRYCKGTEFIASIFLVHLKPVGGMTAPICLMIYGSFLFLPSSFPSTSHTPDSLFFSSVFLLLLLMA